MRSVSELDRRTFLKASGAVGALLALPIGLSARAVEAATEGTHLVALSRHEYDVVVAASARLIPGPDDEPSEQGHPGAREARAGRYIDGLLGALSVSPPKLFAGGPFSDRAGHSGDDMAAFLRLTPAQQWAWSRRLADWRQQYRRGVRALDQLSGGDFSAATTSAQDAALVQNSAGFTTLLFSHAIEAMYSAPEYGGNAGLIGWAEIGFPGDVEPRGYSDEAVSTSSGTDRYVPNPIGTQVLNIVSIG
jgi:hypothetical protein